MMTIEPKATTAQPDVTVREVDGMYSVAATFNVPQSAPVVFDVLTAYEQIPRFMPDVRSSRVLERGEGRAVVEQEAVVSALMFSKRVHLVLDITEATPTIRFRDRSGESFAHYQGAWTISSRDTQVVVAYELTAKPAFDVPGFLLKRLMKRDAQEMIERLRAEMVRRDERKPFDAHKR